MGLRSLIILRKIHSSWRRDFLIPLDCKLSCVDAFSEPNCFHMNSGGEIELLKLFQLPGEALRSSKGEFCYKATWPIKLTS